MKRLLGSICLLLILGGCASGGSGAKWYAPATWFSHSAANRVDSANREVDKATLAVIKEAQKGSHETALALAQAPDSRPVQIATGTNAEVVTLLDQAVGSLDAKTIEKLRTTITGLLSENVKVREEAEKQRKKEQETIVDVSTRLSKANERSDKAEAGLRAAFERENALANELRSQRALMWIAIGIALLAAAGWTYVKVVLGGMPNAIGLAMKDIKIKHPDVAATISPFYTKYLNLREQAAISRSSKP